MQVQRTVTEVQSTSKNMANCKKKPRLKNLSTLILKTYTCILPYNAKYHLYYYEGGLNKQ